MVNSCRSTLLGIEQCVTHKLSKPEERQGYQTDIVVNNGKPLSRYCRHGPHRRSGSIDAGIIDASGLSEMVGLIVAQVFVRPPHRF